MPYRIQLHRTPGWRMPAGTMKVDRSTRWGNPFSATDPHRQREAYLLTRQGLHWLPGCRWTIDDVVRMHAEWLAGQIPRGTDGRALPIHPKVMPTRPDLTPLRGKHLACWCRLDKPCHADALLRLANAEGESPDAPAPLGQTPGSQLD
jgi:hypothetical protein